MGDKKAKETCTPTSAAAFVSGVATGTIITITTKLMFETTSIGIDGKSAKFEKPMFLSFCMFTAMMSALPLYFITRKYNKSKEKDNEANFKKKVYFLMAIPAALDLTASILGQYGLVYLTPSLYELIRSCVIIVTALLKVTVLRQKLKRYMWYGVGINFLAMCLISAPTFFNKNDDQGETRDPRIGVFFIMGSCIVQGIQYVYEEKVMKVNKAPALVVVGMEGVWGFLISLIICFPVFYFVPGKDKGSMENMWDAFVMLKNNATLYGLVILYFFVIAFYNMVAVYVTKLLSSIWHAILEDFRPVAVWAVDLAIFYLISRSFGESWMWPGSYIQLGGMIVLFFGTAVYNGSVPWLGHTKKEREDEENEKLKGSKSHDYGSIKEHDDDEL